MFKNHAKLFSFENFFFFVKIEHYNVPQNPCQSI